MENAIGSNKKEFVSAGKQIDTIAVQISHHIIQLFSEGLYSSSNKAIEEFVSSSFYSGVHNVHVISSDLRSVDASWY